MKQFILTTILIMLTVFVNAQPNVQVGLGASTQKYATGELSAGYNFGPAFIQAGYLASLSRNVDGGTFINGVIGKRMTIYEDWFVEPALGYSYILRSMDRKELNEKALIFTAGIGRIINDGSLILKGVYCNRVAVIELVMRVNL